MTSLFVLLLLGSLAVPLAPDCVGLSPPVDGPVLRGFAPTGRYTGHFGVDLGVGEGTVVRAAGPGRVSFSGEVAGRSAVTIDHGGGLKSTVSAVAERLVSGGSRVAMGLPIAVSGEHDGQPAVHVSVRIDGRYVDPLDILACRVRPPAGALRLVPVP